VVVALTTEGMKVLPVASNVPPLATLYQRSVSEEDAFKVSVPGPQMLVGVTLGEVGGANKWKENSSVSFARTSSTASDV
jgi:hypothetical protein